MALHLGRMADLNGGLERFSRHVSRPGNVMSGRVGNGLWRDQPTTGCHLRWEAKDVYKALGTGTWTHHKLCDWPA